jgi:competence protein ComEC
MCDVGQGTGVLLELPGTQNALMIDAGPATGKVDQCIQKLGVKTITMAVFSHLHEDHVGGVVSVKEPIEKVVTPDFCGASEGIGVLEKKFNTKKVEVLRYAAGSATANNTNSMAATNAATPSLPGASGSAIISSVKQGAEFKMKLGVSAEQMLTVFIFPSPLDAKCAATKPTSQDQNNAGLTVVVQYRGVNFWFLGDLEASGQDALLKTVQSYGESSLTASANNVVVMAHHGGSSQSAKLEQFLRPKLTLISCAKHNSYGHPSKKALEIYQDSRILTTPNCGLISLGVAGGELRASCNPSPQ